MVVIVPMEVKNVRDWIHPDMCRLHELLYEAAVLQRLHPDAPIVPLLACGKAHITTYWMASVFGFHGAQANVQFILRRADITPRMLAEVEQELDDRSPSTSDVHVYLHGA